MNNQDKCHTCHNNICTKRVPLFSSLNEVEVKQVTNLIIQKSYKKGEVIISEGDIINRLIILRKGSAKGNRYNQDGKEQILHLYAEGDFIGEKYLLKRQEASFNITALEEVHVCMIQKEDFQQLMLQFPSIVFKVLEELALRIEKLEQTIETIGSYSVEDRVKRALLEFTDKFSTTTKDGLLIALPLNREGIANYIGLTRETVTRTLNQLQNDGQIKMIGNKKILILTEELKTLKKN